MMFMQEASKHYQNYSSQKENLLRVYQSCKQEVSFLVTPIDLKHVEIKFWIENSDPKFDDYEVEYHIKTMELDYWFNEENYIKMFKLIIKETQEELTQSEQSILNDLKEKYLYYSIED